MIKKRSRTFYSKITIFDLLFYEKENLNLDVAKEKRKANIKENRILKYIDDFSIFDRV